MAKLNFISKPIFMAGVLLFAIVFLLSFSGRLPVPKISVKFEHGSSTKHEHKYKPSYNNAAGTELIFVYIGCSTCASANEPSLPGIVKSLKLKISDKAFMHNYKFVAIGISKDWIVKNGIKHLNKFGNFDEIMTGRNWLNTGLIKYIWQGYKSIPSVPQVIVLKHELVNRGNSQINIYSIKNESLLTRKLGLNEIRQWEKDNAPLPLN